MNSIATSSVEEGLDFGFNLLIGTAADVGREDQALAQRILPLVQGFVQPRYAGELDIALDGLEALAECIAPQLQRNRTQIEAQLAWLREQLPTE